MSYLSKRSEFETYFENIAKKYVPVGHSDSEKHFFRNIDDFQKSKPKGRVMVINGRPTRFTDQKSDNILKVRYFQLWIIESCKMEDITRQNAIYDETEKDCDNIVARIKSDLNKFPVTGRPAAGFDINNATLEAIGPMGADNWFGTEIIIPLVHPCALVYNQNDTTLWNP